MLNLYIIFTIHNYIFKRVVNSEREEGFFNSLLNLEKLNC